MSKLPGWARQFFPLLLAVIVGACLVGALQHYSSEIGRNAARIDKGMLTLGLGYCIVYRVLNASGWVLVLKALRHPMPMARGVRLWILSESARWLPGSVWGFCSRVVQATRAGIPPAIASISLPVELLLTIAAWTVVATVGMWSAHRSVDWSGLWSPRLILFVGLAGALLSVGAILYLARLPTNPLIAKIRAMQRELRVLRGIDCHPAQFLGVFALYAGLCCLNGLAFSCVVRSLSDAPMPLVAILGINACGWLTGFFAIGAPGGIGVREGSAALLLSTMMPMSTAVAATVLWRLVMVIDETLCLTACLTPNAVPLIAKLAKKPVCEA